MSDDGDDDDDDGDDFITASVLNFVIILSILTLMIEGTFGLEYSALYQQSSGGFRSFYQLLSGGF